MKYTPEIAKKRSIFHGTSNSLPMVADPGGLSLLKKIKISFTIQKIYSQKVQKTEYILPSPQLTPRSGDKPRTPGAEKKLVYPRDKYTPKKVQKTEYIKLVIPVTYQDGPLCWVHHQGRGTLQDR